MKALPHSAAGLGLRVCWPWGRGVRRAVLVPVPVPVLGRCQGQERGRAAPHAAAGQAVPRAGTRSGCTSAGTRCSAGSALQGDRGHSVTESPGTAVISTGVTESPGTAMISTGVTESPGTGMLPCPVPVSDTPRDPHPVPCSTYPSRGMLAMCCSQRPQHKDPALLPVPNILAQDTAPSPAPFPPPDTAGDKPLVTMPSRVPHGRSPRTHRERGVWQQEGLIQVRTPLPWSQAGRSCGW